MDVFLFLLCLVCFQDSLVTIASDYKKSLITSDFNSSSNLWTVFVMTASRSLSKPTLNKRFCSKQTKNKGVCFLFFWVIILQHISRDFASGKIITSKALKASTNPQSMLLFYYLFFFVFVFFFVCCFLSNGRKLELWIINFKWQFARITNLFEKLLDAKF